MIRKKKILGICGSASSNSGNLTILKTLTELSNLDFDFEIINNLTELPHFKTELTSENIPEIIVQLRTKIEKADGIIICTPEYIFSIPSGLKNMIEWCVSTTVFSDKPVGLITASSSGIKGQEELKLIMKTIQARFTEETTLLIQGIKGKVNKDNNVLDIIVKDNLKKLLTALQKLIFE